MFFFFFFSIFCPQPNEEESRQVQRGLVWSVSGAASLSSHLSAVFSPVTAGAQGSPQGNIDGNVRHGAVPLADGSQRC